MTLKFGSMAIKSKNLIFVFFLVFLNLALLKGGEQKQEEGNHEKIQWIFIHGDPISFDRSQAEKWITNDGRQRSGLQRSLRRTTAFEKNGRRMEIYRIGGIIYNAKYALNDEGKEDKDILIQLKFTRDNN